MQNHEHKLQSNSLEVPVTIPAFIAVEIAIKNSTFLAHMISKTVIILVYFFPEQFHHTSKHLHQPSRHTYQSQGHHCYLD